MGTFKLLVLLIPIILYVLGKVGVFKLGFKEGMTVIFMMGLIIAFSLASFVWWLADAIKFGLNKYRNEVPLKKW